MGFDFGNHISEEHAFESFKYRPIIVSTEIGNITEIHKDVVTYDWEIKHFTSICPEFSTGFQPIRSPSLKVGKDVETSSVWFFELRNNSGYLSMSMCRDKSNETKVENPSAVVFFPQISCKFQMVTSTGDILQEGDGVPHKVTDDDDAQSLLQRVQYIWKDRVKSKPLEQCEWSNFIYLRDLFECRERFLKENSLHFHMKFEIPKIISCDNSGVSPEAHFRTNIDEAINRLEGKCRASLASDITSMLWQSTENSSSDFTIHCGPKSFPVHKAVIIGRCKKLYQVLVALMAAKQTRILQNTDPALATSAVLTNIDPETLKALLEFIYTGTFSSNDKDLNQLKLLLQEAIKYELECMKQHCFVAMVANLSVDNVAPIISLAELYGAADEIKSYVYSFCDM